MEKKSKKKSIPAGKKDKKTKEDDIAVLKEKIKHQKDALNKIIEKYSSGK